MAGDKDELYREVYSTEGGARCGKCQRPLKDCNCAQARRHKIVGDGNVRVRRESKGRGGKTVTTISGLKMNRDELRALLSELKTRFGTGGTEKDGVLEIQGDHRDLIVQELLKRSIKAKCAGG